MKEIELQEEQSRPADLVGQTNDQVDATMLGLANTVAPKRGCLKSKNLFLSPDFDEVDMGFDQPTCLWG